MEPCIAAVRMGAAITAPAGNSRAVRWSRWRLPMCAARPSLRGRAPGLPASGRNNLNQNSWRSPMNALARYLGGLLEAWQVSGVLGYLLIGVWLLYPVAIATVFHPADAVGFQAWLQGAAIPR